MERVYTSTFGLSFVGRFVLFHLSEVSLYYLPNPSLLSPSSGARQAQSNVSHDETEPVSILHPEAARAESILRNAWGDAKLVAD